MLLGCEIIDIEVMLEEQLSGRSSVCEKHLIA